ncbi:Leucyl/phenylalanyl-tRNA--protein transferase [Dirofilaria immitis]
MEKLQQYNHQMEERYTETNRLKQRKRKSNYKLQLSNAHYRRKAARDNAVSSDNTLREITGDMPNIELKHASSKEAIYTDDQLIGGNSGKRKK